MRISEAIFATTHVDTQNEAFALSALEAMASRVNSAYVSVGVEHDPRVAPIGRVTRALVRERGDGEYELAGEIEFFEAGDRIEIESDSRQVIVNYHDGESVILIDDRSFANDEDQAALRELREIIGARAETESKKSVDPISVLTIALTVIATKIAEGFVGEIGGEAFQTAKVRLKKLFGGKRSNSAQLLNLSMTVELAGALRLIEIILANPTGADIEGLTNDIVQTAVEVANKALAINPHIVRFVFSYAKGGGLAPSFCVLKNGCPVALIPSSNSFTATPYLPSNDRPQAI